MRTFFPPVVFAALGAWLFASCADAPKVVQGTVISYDAAAKSLVLKDECPPNQELTLNLSGAEIGAEVQAGDIVLAAYRPAPFGSEPEAQPQGRRPSVAIRVMNISRQKERGLKDLKSTSKHCEDAAP